MLGLPVPNVLVNVLMAPVLVIRPMATREVAVVLLLISLEHELVVPWQSLDVLIYVRSVLVSLRPVQAP